MFYGNEFIYDGISCYDFGLMLVGELNGESQDGKILGGELSLSEDSIVRQGMPIYYGIQPASPLEFSLILSVRESGDYLSRQDMASVAEWLYGRNEYKTLYIMQNDMQDYYYRCIVTSITQNVFGGNTIGINVTFRCDSPYGYLRMSDSVYKSSDWLTPAVIGETYVAEPLSVKYYNYSNVNQYYKPIITIMLDGKSDSFSFYNETTDDTLTVTDLPSQNTTIVVDCLRQIITSNKINNVYDKSNLVFPSFVRGYNQLTITGSFKVSIRNDFPMIVGI